MKAPVICDRKLCSGCAACANVCMKNAISMKANWQGFLYPSINEALCVSCGLCQKVCPQNKSREDFVFPKTFVFIEKNEKYLLNASSGGAFGVVARYVLSRGGRVYGCEMTSNYEISYTVIDSVEDLPRIQGSKYAQADIGLIFRNIKTDLASGKMVLFCGCPCQVAGLKGFIGKENENLVTMDLICHGVPSQPYFRSYVKDLLSRISKNGITKFKFRHKDNSDVNKSAKSDVYVGFSNLDYYMTYFLWGKGYRSSCYSCRYAGGKREGDFTIGDFWNNRNAKFDIDVSKGSSLVLMNTKKAEQLGEIFKENGIVVSVKSLDEAIGADGGQLKHPSKYDIRSTFIHILFRCFGVAGPKFLYKLDLLRMGKKA